MCKRDLFDRVSVMRTILVFMASQLITLKKPLNLSVLCVLLVD